MPAIRIRMSDRPSSPNISVSAQHASIATAAYVPGISGTIAAGHAAFAGAGYGLAGGASPRAGHAAVTGIGRNATTSSLLYPTPATLSYVLPTTKALPAVGVSTYDSAWDIYYTRVTGITPARKQYATHPLWNSTGTRIYVEGSATGGGQHSLIDTTTWTVLDEMGGVPGDQIWAWTAADRMYGVTSNRLVYVDIDTDAQTTVKTFTGYSSVRLGFGDGAFSWDDRYFLLFGTTTGGAKHLIRYDRTLDTYGTRTITNTPNNLKASPTGAYGVINYESNDGTGAEQGVWLVDSALANVRQLQDNGDHGDVGKDASGNEIYVSGYPGGSKAVNHYSYRLDQSTSALDVGPLVPQASAQLFQAGHAAMCSPDRGGMAILSAYGSWTLEDPYNYDLVAGYSQVIGVPTDGSAFADGNPVEPWGFHLSSHTQDGGDAAYDREPQASPNRNGSQIAITTKWSTSQGITGDTYVFILSKAPI